MSQMPDWQYRLWSDEDNVELVKRVLPEHVEDFANLPANVARTDVARCLYMYVHGGIYFDTDYRFFRAVDDTFLRHRCVLGVESPLFVADGTNGTGAGYKVGNAFLASEPGLELWRLFVVSVFDRLRSGERDVLYLGGPHALSIFLKAHPEIEREVSILPGHVLFPNFRLGKLTVEKRPDTIGAHLCWGGWRNKSPTQRLRNEARKLLSASLSYQSLL